MALTEQQILGRQYIASVIQRQMDRHHFERSVRHDLLSSLRTIPTAILSLGRISRKQYLTKLDEADFEDYPLYGDIDE